LTDVSARTVHAHAKPWAWHPSHGTTFGTAGASALFAGGQANGDYVSPTDSYQHNGLHLYRLFGDANGDGVVDATDLGQLRSTMNLNSSELGFLWYFDADNNLVVDSRDSSQFSARWNHNVFV
jgi:hypothetical protein